jgi:hypothetical protein
MTGNGWIGEGRQQWESVHVCPRYGHVINLEELDLRAITTGIVMVRVAIGLDKLKFKLSTKYFVRSDFSRLIALSRDGKRQYKQRLLDKDLDQKTKQPFAFKMRENTAFAFAGLWDAWKDPSGEWLQSYSLITTEANELAFNVIDRMPVILHPKD